MELKDVVQDLGHAFEEFKRANDERLSQLATKGSVDAVVNDNVEKVNGVISDLQSRLEKAEVAASRRAKANAEPDGMDQKAAEWAAGNASRRGMRLESEFGAADLKGYRKAFVEYMRKGAMAEDLHAKALSVGIDPDGGYVVDPDTSGRIVTKVFESSPMRQFASVQTIGTDALEGLYDLDQAASGWVGETQARPTTATPQLGKYRIPVHELYANPAATQKLLDDASVNMEAWLAGKVSEKFARDEATAFVNGDGNGKPRGFLTYANGTNIPGQIQQIKSGANAGFPAGNPDALLDAIYGLKAAYRTGARWAMNRTTQALVRKVKMDNQYVWVPGLGGGMPASLLGFPVAEFEDMPNPDNSSLSIAFANFAEAYQIVDRAGVRVLRDPYTAKPYVLFYTTKRVGGDVVNFEAVKIIRFDNV
jgi:HK97 family phage major capsid protein